MKIKIFFYSVFIPFYKNVFYYTKYYLLIMVITVCKVVIKISTFVGLQSHLVQCVGKEGLD